MRIRNLQREELEHAHAERKDVRGHRGHRIPIYIELGGVPTHGDHGGEADHGGFADDVGEDLGEPKIGERDDALGVKMMSQREEKAQ